MNIDSLKACHNTIENTIYICSRAIVRTSVLTETVINPRLAKQVYNIVCRDKIQANVCMYIMDGVDI